MSKNQFRILIITSLVLGLLSGIYDYLWPNPETEKVYNYIVEIEAEIEGARLVIVGVLGVIAIIMLVVSIIGLLLFKSWGRHVYVAGFIVAFSLYPFVGVAVSSGFAQVLYDISMVFSGVLLALMYYSPVAKYYEN